MREISKRNQDGQIEIQEMLKCAQTELKQAQITAVCTQKVAALEELKKSVLQRAFEESL